MPEGHDKHEHVGVRLDDVAVIMNESSDVDNVGDDHDEEEEGLSLSGGCEKIACG